MSDLAAFQRHFADCLRDAAAPAEPRLAVYRNTAAKGLVDALAANYGTVRALLGDEFFEGAASAFARAHPPATPVLAGYGESFADFLQDQPWTSGLRYVADVARLDRLWTEAHLAADADPLQPEDLADVGPEAWIKLRLPLHPAARIAWLPTPAVSIWMAHRREDCPIAAEPRWQAEGALFARPWGEVELLPISAAEHRLLAGLRLGETVGQAAISAASLYPDTDLSSLFARIIASGALVAPPRKG